MAIVVAPEPEGATVARELEDVEAVTDAVAADIAAVNDINEDFLAAAGGRGCWCNPAAAIPPVLAPAGAAPADPGLWDPPELLAGPLELLPKLVFRPACGGSGAPGFLLELPGPTKVSTCGELAPELNPLPGALPCVESSLLQMPTRQIHGK
jgi:hypothetical protein